jgi:hypothetical protein
MTRLRWFGLFVLVSLLIIRLWTLIPVDTSIAADPTALVAHSLDETTPPVVEQTPPGPYPRPFGCRIWNVDTGRCRVEYPRDLRFWDGNAYVLLNHDEYLNARVTAGNQDFFNQCPRGDVPGEYVMSGDMQLSCHTLAIAAGLAPFPLSPSEIAAGKDPYLLPHTAVQWAPPGTHGEYVGPELTFRNARGDVSPTPWP